MPFYFEAKNGVLLCETHALISFGRGKKECIALIHRCLPIHVSLFVLKIYECSLVLFFMGNIPI